MSDPWWLPLLAVVLVWGGIVLTAGIVTVIGAVLRTRFSAEARLSVGGLAIAVLIVYVVCAFGYALFTAEPRPDGDSQCLGPPSTSC